MSFSDEISQSLQGLLEAFEALGIRYYISGSLASSAHGLPRTTRDVDLVAALFESHIEPLVSRLEQDYYIDADMIRDAMHHRMAFNVLYLATMLKIDIFPLLNEPFALSAFRRATSRPLDFGQGQQPMRLATAEDIVLHKMRWYELTQRSSERQWLDILGVLKVQQDNLDLEYVTHWAKNFGLVDLLEQALRDSRIEE